MVENEMAGQQATPSTLLASNGFLARFGAAIAIGLLSAASLPPLGLWPLSLVAPALLLLLIRDLPGQQAGAFGLVYGLTFGFGTLYWLFGLFGVVAAPLIGLFGLYFGLFAALVGLTRGYPPWVRAVLAGLFAVGVEWLRGDAWYLRFPWYAVPHALAAQPAWIAPVRWLGAYGYTWLIWSIAGAGAFSRICVWAAFLFLPASAFLLAPVTPADRRAQLVQTESSHDLEALFPKLGADQVDLIVLPEYAYFSSYQSILAGHNSPADLARKSSCPVVFGAIDGNLSDPEFQNVAVVLDSRGEVLGTFPKQRPVPLFHDGTAGDRRPVFPVDAGTLGVAVCYDFDAPEIAGSLVAAGATVLVAPTFDARSWGQTQHIHHELLLRLRAVETDRWIVRAASSGRSEAVSPRGVPSHVGIEIGETGVAGVAFGHCGTWTLGSQMFRLGPWAALATLILLVLSAVRTLPVFR